MTQSPIDSFTGEYRFLSNFWPANIVTKVDGKEVIVPTVEHAYQALKTVIPEERAFVVTRKTAGQAKRAGQRVTLRPEWPDDEFKVLIMKGLVELKFTRDPVIAQKLLETGERELIEGNTWGDTFWGVCDGVGTNWLGKILMDVRHRLREGTLS